jgi:tetratricopeptide (TPR) repeat protein
LDAADSALLIRRDDGALHVVKAASELSLGDFNSALRSLEIASSLGYESDSSHYISALILANGEKFALALDEIEKCVSDITSGPGFLYNKALILLHLNKVPEAIEGFERASELLRDTRDQRSFALAEEGIATCLLSQGRTAAARLRLFSAIEKVPSTAELGIILAIACCDLGDETDDNAFFVEAIQNATSALQQLRKEQPTVARSRRNAAVLAIRGRAHAALNELGNAKRDLEGCVAIFDELEDSAPVARANLARINRAVRVSGTIPTWLPYVTAASALVVVILSTILLVIGALQSVAFATIVVASVLIVPLSFLIPTLSRFKVGAVELEKVSQTTVPTTMRLESAGMVALLDAHGSFREIVPIQVAGHQSPEGFVRPPVQGSRWRAAATTVKPED